MNSDTLAELAFKRRFALLALLHRRPHSYAEIIASLDREQLFSYDREEDSDTIARKQRYQFRYDLRALQHVGYDIHYERSSKCYVWHNSPFGLFLNQAQLQALALLTDTFTDSTLPHANDLLALLKFLIERLPGEQQKVVNQQRRAFHIDLHETTDYRQADPETLKEIEKAIRCNQQLEFSYCAPYKGQERRHVIEPWALVFRRGHVYLQGWSLAYQNEATFRLDYIVPGSAHMGNTVCNKHRPSSPVFVLRYRLSPAIARHKVSEHFPGQHVERHADGSATITARVSSLFEARRVVLSYGINCVVLEPPELVAQMRMVRDHFNTTYPTPGE